MSKKIKLHHDNRLRSLVKSVSFRSMVVISDSFVVTLITGNIPEVFQVVLFTNAASTVLYYLHERIWNMLGWQKVLRGHLDGEHISRSLVKAISFRIVVVTSDFLIITTVTGSSSAATGIAVFTNLFSTLLYFLHERIWNNISWGRI